VPLYIGDTLDFIKVVGAIAITAFISYSLLDAGFLRGNHKKFFPLVRNLRPMMFLSNLPIQVLTIAAGFTLNSVVGLKWGWTSFLHSDGSTSNVNMIGLQYAWFAPVFALLLIVALPLLANLEEEMFRVGTKGIKSALKRSLIFGLVHMIAGVSLGYALALTIPGLWFTYQYKKGGLARSSAYHLAWNLTLVSLLLLLLFTSGM
jgi:hypothetical protein